MEQPSLKKAALIASIAIASATYFFTKNKAPENIVVENEVEITEEQKPSKKPFIDPPLEGIDIPFQNFTINTEEGETIKLKSGSVITIPKNAFIDKDGKPISGNIELKYREFRDPIDFFVSGINMTYDSMGTKYPFESAGMMEIKGYQNGQIVFIAPNSTIDIQLASDYAETNYNLYKANLSENNWKCIGKDKVVTPPKKTAEKLTAPTIIEETPAYTTLEKEKKVALTEKEEAITALPKLSEKPQKPVKASKERFAFNLEVNDKEFPELAVYKGALFEVGAENKDVNTKLLSTITWSEAIIKEGTKKGKNYLLTLKKGSESKKLIVYPVFEGDDYKVASNTYQKKFERYNTLLTKRRDEEKAIEERYQARLSQLIAEQKKLRISREEKVKAAFNKLDLSSKVKRTFAINSFGIYNCDKPASYPKGVSCMPTLNKANSTKLMSYDIYLVDKKNNALYNFNKNPLRDFSFNPKSENLLWAIENGKLYWLKPSAFANIKEETKEIELQKIEQKLNSVSEIKAFFNI